jgi:hypothetical protein
MALSISAVYICCPTMLNKTEDLNVYWWRDGFWSLRLVGGKINIIATGKCIRGRMSVCIRRHKRRTYKYHFTGVGMSVKLMLAWDFSPYKRHYIQGKGTRTYIWMPIALLVRKDCWGRERNRQMHTRWAYASAGTRIVVVKTQGFAVHCIGLVLY